MIDTTIIGAITLIAIIVGCETRLAGDRKQLLKERDAWAAAAATERETLLRHATDERAALLTGLTQMTVPTTATWSNTDPSRLYKTEDDEIAISNPELIEDELAKRGLMNHAET